MSHVIYLNVENMRPVKGTLDHGDWDDILMRYEDGEMNGWDLDALTGIVLYRFDAMCEGEDDGDEDGFHYAFEE